ncbi:hypothetical protein [Lampropedia hyalina]|jgi:hypothetical protein|nr:hypothetical protein [Lampropedia hyalina]
MLKALLIQLEQAFPPELLHADSATWPELTHQFSIELCSVVEALLATASIAIPKRIFKESKQEYLVTRQPTTTVAEFRFRPQSGYFTKMRRRPPRPEDPKGTDATGLEVSITLCRGYPASQFVRRPLLSIDFQIWGEFERTRFHDLLREHRYLVEQLVLASKGTFSTSCVFDNVDRARKATAFEKLSLYYENEIDNENTFSIQCEFGHSATEAALLQALLPLLALYDATMGYCLPREQRARVLAHLGIVQ